MNSPKSNRTSNAIRTVFVSNAEQLAHAFAVRSICFLEDRGLPFNQDRDENDYHATHVVMYDADEPIGAARLRWFQDFAKWERSCFRPAWRNMRIIKRCADAIFDHVSKKGFPRVLTHAEERYANVWVRLMGFEKTGRVLKRGEGGRELIELIKKVEPSRNAITQDADPSLLVRVEGRWDLPSAYG